MKNAMNVALIGAITAISIAATARAADWPMWGGGPHRNMTSGESGIPATFNAGRLAADNVTIDPQTTQNIRWVARMGSQTYGNPTAAQGRVFVGTNNEGRGDDRFRGDYSLIKCLDEKTGEVLWTFTSPKLGAGKVSDWEFLGVCSSPAIDGDRVYFATNLCQIICVDLDGMADGNDGFQDEGSYMASPDGKRPPVEVRDTDADIIWVFNMTEELGVFPHNITSTSPLVFGDLVYAATSNGKDWTHTNTPNPKAPALIALDKMTGELRGEEVSGISERIMHCNWSSPSVGTVNGRDILFFGAGDGFLYAYDPIPVPDPDDPEFNIFRELWRYDCVPHEYRYDEDGAERKYNHRGQGPSEIIATPVFADGRVYVGIGQDPEHGTGVGNFSCIDAATGRKIWDFQKLGRTISTAAVHDGRVYISDYAGFVYCLDAINGQEYWVEDTLSHIWGSPLVVDGKLYIGTQDGILLVFDATNHNKKKIAEIDVGDPIYSSPIAANGKLFVGTQTQLYAVESE